jgi:cell division protein FtsA
MKKDIVVGLDIGTTKICAMVAEKVGDGSFRLRGMGITPSVGLRKGVVVNIEDTVNSISRAVREAEEAAGIEIESVFAGIAGGHIKSLNSRGIVANPRANKEINQWDVEKAINSASAMSIPMDREVIHILPQEFIVDNQTGVKNPVGMMGNRLEVLVHIVTAAVTSAQNIVKCVQQAGLEVEDIVLEPLASALAVLTPEEKKHGSILLDMGGGTTDAVIFSNGGIRLSEVFSFGGDHITNDIAIGLRTTTEAAEKIKKTSGCGVKELVPSGEIVKVASLNNDKIQHISRQTLAEIIEARVEEILSLIDMEISKVNLKDQLAGGVVLTGGSSLLMGIIETARRMFDSPARIGRPNLILKGLEAMPDTPILSTAAGLCLYGFQFREGGIDAKLTGRNLFTKVLDRMRMWLNEYF